MCDFCGTCDGVVLELCSEDCRQIFGEVPQYMGLHSNKACKMCGLLVFILSNMETNAGRMCHAPGIPPSELNLYSYCPGE